VTPDRDASDGAPTDGEDGTGADADGDDPFEHLPEGTASDDPFERLPEGDASDDPFERMDADPAEEIEADASDAGESVVPKHRYCESCEHFEAPPAVRCTHPGTEIRELVDMEHFRVFDCPVVADRREMAEIVAAGADAAVEERVRDADEG